QLFSLITRHSLLSSARHQNPTTTTTPTTTYRRMSFQVPPYAVGRDLGRGYSPLSVRVTTAAMNRLLKCWGTLTPFSPFRRGLPSFLVAGGLPASGVACGLVH